VNTKNTNDTTTTVYGVYNMIYDSTISWAYQKHQKNKQKQFEMFFRISCNIYINNSRTWLFFTISCNIYINNSRTTLENSCNIHINNFGELFSSSDHHVTFTLTIWKTLLFFLISCENIYKNNLKSWLFFLLPIIM
jgi:hypothetical protein